MLAILAKLVAVAAAAAGAGSGGGVAATSRPDVVGWWVGDESSSYPSSSLDWDVLTILVVHPNTGGIKADANGVASCAPPVPFIAELAATARRNNVKVMWAPGCDAKKAMSNSSYRMAYLATVAAAAAPGTACFADGIEFDYEPATGLVTPAEASRFTELLAEIKQAFPQPFLISADVGVHGYTQGSYPLLVEPWVNVTMLNAGDIDFVNTMSYHMPWSGSIKPWEADGAWLDKHGIDRGRVNIGLPYFAFNTTRAGRIVAEPTWGSLSLLCPNAAPDQAVCAGIAFCGKRQNLEIGLWIKSQGWRGAFPWAANYDAVAKNDSLLAWLGRGLLLNLTRGGLLL